MEEKRLIIGPSHIMRWLQSMEIQYVPEVDGVAFYGQGGAPIWCDYFAKKEADFTQYDEVIYIVGDFRLGNKSVLDPTFQYGIEKTLISHENDLILYNKTVNKVSDLIGKHGVKVKFLFWSLALREYKNIQDDKYISDKKYKHPIWNINPLEEKFSGNCIPLAGCLSENMDSLFIDSSNHPSIVGYAFLYNLLIENKDDASTILHKLNNKNKDTLLIPRSPISTQIVGDSTIIRHHNAFIRKGIFKGDIIPEVTLSKINEYINANPHIEELVFFSNIRCFNDNDLPYQERITRLFNMVSKSKVKIKVVFYDAFAQEVISTRHKAYAKLKPKSKLLQFEQLERLFDCGVSYPKLDSMMAESFVELNGGLQPTFKAIFWLINIQARDLDLVDSFYLHYRDNLFSNEM